MRKFANSNSAVEVTRLCYNEPTRNLMYRIQCGDLKDLQECVKVINAYNEFNNKIVNPALERFSKFGNRVNYTIGRECSVVMYLENQDDYNDVKAKEFDGMVQDFATITKADECNKIRNEWRLWWD